MLVDEPLAYASKCGPLPEPEPWLPLVTDNVGVPPEVSTVTFSLKVTVADKVPPSDLSNAVDTQSILVISA
mgnify:FL=1